MKIAVINTGSSSIKFKLFDMVDKKVLYKKTIEHIGEKNGVANHHEALGMIEVDFDEIDVFGHRVVHGGEHFCSSVIIDDEVLKTIKSLCAIAPLHNPANLEGIKVAMQKAKNALHVAVFDTAFHQSMPKEAYMYALPYELYEKYNIRRYGFHGTSHSYLCKQAAKILDKEIDEVNLITLHLGNGASVCAIKNGKSIDTSMGFTPLEGLVMGSRSGDVDAGIVVYLQRELGLSVDEVDELLNKHSGLLGICHNNDVREILSKNDELSKLAIEIMVRRIQKYIGAYMALLDNVDAIVFSGGIGEHSSYIQDRVMDMKLTKEIKKLVIATDEELEIANECYKLIPTR